MDKNDYRLPDSIESQHPLRQATTNGRWSASKGSPGINGDDWLVFLVMTVHGLLLSWSWIGRFNCTA